MSQTETMLAWTAVTAISACLVGAVFGFLNSRRKRVPGPVVGLAIIWTLVVCVLAWRHRPGTPDVETTSGKKVSEASSS